LATILTLALLLTGSASMVSAQTDVTAADVQRLEDSIDDASRDVAQVRTRDSRLASDLERQLGDARDEAFT
jgi:TolA-binding protein